MKSVVYLAPGNSVHTAKWLNSLAEAGYRPFLLTLHPPTDDQGLNPGIEVCVLKPGAPAGYLLSRDAVRKNISKIRPALLHTHYASGYGMLSRLVDFRPTILSVWGSDVFEFPDRSSVHRYFLGQNLKHPDKILATSSALKRRVLDLSGRESEVIAFGVDTEKFQPENSCRDITDSVTIGTVKAMHPRYGIDLLLKAFVNLKSLLQLNKGPTARLVVVGGGAYLDRYKDMAHSLGITADVSFPGKIAHSEVPKTLRTFDVFVAPSRQESFGVSVLEASATGIPVVVSNVGGLPEVVDHEKTGIIVPAENIQKLATALYNLVIDTSRRQNLGKSGREMVVSRFSWEKSVEQLLHVYHHHGG